MLNKVVMKYKDQMYLVFRVFVGLLFAQHGAQKLFGLLGGQQAALASLFGAAGVIELVGGLMLALGLFVRPAALVTAGEMVVAYFMVHAKMGLVPIQNQGELALLYFAAFLVLLVHGAGRWGLERALLKKESF